MEAAEAVVAVAGVARETEPLSGGRASKPGYLGSMRRALLLVGLVSATPCLVHCSSTPEETTPTEGESAEEALKYNGGNTGAFLRETTPAGYGCITTTVTVPDYTGDEATQGTPWIYFGFGDEASLDMEVGLAFQKGNGTAEKPRRYLPYMRRGQSFWFAEESERVLPGKSTKLVARLVGDKVYLNKDGRPISMKSSTGDSIDFVRVDGLTVAKSHVRRVVGQATRIMDYKGGRLGTVGPVFFDDTRVCKSDGAEVAFQGDVASWSERKGQTTYGTSVWPARYVSRVRTGAREEIWLFK